MTIQEAIEYMRMYKGENVNGESHLGHAFDLSDEIIDMAIEALQRGLENVNADSCSEEPNMSEPKTAENGSLDSEQPEIKADRTIGGMIYRQDAIDALCAECTVDNPKTCSTIQEGDRWCDEVYILLNLPSAQPETIIESDESIKLQNSNDTISRQAAIRWVKSECNPYGKPTLDYESGIKVIEHLERMPSAQPETHDKRTETHACDLIDRQKVRYKLTALVNELEEIFAHIRERNVDDSVCGLCEYDGAYMGQSGDWCNECPGFDMDDCFKLKEKYREEWLKIDG